jgi:hypothetical protein
MTTRPELQKTLKGIQYTDEEERESQHNNSGKK